jgi:hypothetical protein
VNPQPVEGKKRTEAVAMKIIMELMALLVVLCIGQAAAQASSTDTVSQSSWRNVGQVETHGSYLRRLCLPPGCGSSQSSSSSSGSGSDGTDTRNGGFDSANQGPSRKTSLLAYVVTATTVLGLFGAAYIRRRRVSWLSVHCAPLAIASHV